MKASKRWLLLAAALLLTAPGLGVRAQEGEEPERDRGKAKKDLPLEPVRKLEFSTDEGTWLSLDVSPDGSTVLFELLGDLYTVPLSGGEATRITDGMAYDSQPRFSPDGEWIAFISDRSGSDNVWIAKADGSEPRKLTSERRRAPLSPAWTPDSDYVLYSKGGRGGVHIWMSHVNGGSGINLTGSQPSQGQQQGGPGGNSGSRTRYGATMSPDGRFLYFARRNAGSVYNQMSFDWQIYRRDMRSGDVDRVTQAQGGAFRPLLSPDGRFLVYGTRFETETGLRIRDLNSGQDRWLKYPVQRDDMESRGSRDTYPSYAFTPDGNRIVITYGGKIHSVDVQTGQADLVEFEADVNQDLGPLLLFQRRAETGPVRSRLLQDPVQSPDGTKLAFSAMAHLYVQELPDGTPRRLTEAAASEFKPAWSPDGRWISYVTWDYNDGGHLWKVPSDGSAGPQQLTSVPAFYTDPVFSPDGERIVTRRGNAWMRSQTPSEFGGLRIQLDLVWVPAGGGDATMIVPARGLSAPHFGPEADRIYFYSRQGLVSMRYDGTDRRTHLKVTGRAQPGARQAPAAERVVISPDGRLALAKVANQVYITTVPPVGGDSAPGVNVFSPSVPTRRLTDIGADSFGWADDGRTITWAVGSTFFRRPLASISFEPEDEGGDRQEGEADEADETDQEEESEQQEAEADEDPPTPKEEHEAVEQFEVVLEFDRHTPSGTAVLRGGTVITMRGDELIEDADIVVVDNRIQAVGRRGEVSIPDGAREFDVSGKTILPGFVDTHAHYEMRTEGVLELHNWSFLANLAYGVTTGLDVQTSTNDYLTYQDLVEAGRMIGPRAYSTGPGVFSSNDFRSGEAARFVLEKYKKYYRNHNLKSYMVGNRQQRQWVVEAAKDLELTVTTEGGLDLKLDMTHALDGFGGNEHSLPIVPLYRDVVELFARSGTSYTPTLLVLYGGPWAENYFYQTTEVHDDPKLNRFVPHNTIDDVSRRRPWFREDEHAFPKTAAQAAKIQRAGGLVGVGAHGQLQGLGYHWEMWSFAMGGMTPREVLKAATIDGARIIGLEQDLGSIEAGKFADLVILNENPLDDIRNTNTVDQVMINGALFEADTLQQLYPRQREPRPFWWWSDDPTVTSKQQ